MSVKIYKLGVSATGVVYGQHSIVHLSGGQTTSANVHATLPQSLITTANLVYTAPYIPNQNVDITSCNIICTTASVGGLARIMIFSDNLGVPGTLLYNSTDLNIATTGLKSYSQKFSFVKGTSYWLAVQTNSSTAILNSLAIGNILNLGIRPSDGVPYTTFTGSLAFASGAQGTFGNYSGQAYGTTTMPYVGLVVA